MKQAHSALIRNLIKLKGTAKLTACAALQFPICKDFKQNIFGILEA